MTRRKSSSLDAITATCRERIMPVLGHWTDVAIAAPDTIGDPLIRIGVELCLESHLLSWATGLPATTNYERWFERPITRITETP